MCIQTFCHILPDSLQALQQSPLSTTGVILLQKLEVGAQREGRERAPSVGSVSGASAPAEQEVSLSIPYQCDSDVVGLTVEELCRSSAVYNAEISWLAFNWRVLSMACSERIPLIERLIYVGISASNLDEFFAKRVGGLKRQVEASKADKLMEEEDAGLIWSPQHQLKLIAKNVKQPLRPTEKLTGEG